MNTPPQKWTAPPDLLRKAQAGDRQARDRLLGWAYVTAHAYYRRKSGVESRLSIADAEDLASAFYLEFARAWPRIQTVYHYTRRMLKNNLHRHLQKARRHRERERLFSQDELARRFGGRQAGFTAWPDEKWSDTDWLRYRVIERVMATSDERTRELVKYRCAEPRMSYREIALRVGVSEASLRMRMTRFYTAVRLTHRLAVSRNKPSEYA